MSPQANDLHKTSMLKFLTQCDDKCGQVMNDISISSIPKETITQTKFKIVYQLNLICFLGSIGRPSTILGVTS